MIHLSEADVRPLLAEDWVFAAVERSFVSAASGAGRNFPVVREAIPEHRGIFGIKSGFDGERSLGLKAGGYWAANGARGLTNHQSSVVLFSPETGEVEAVVAGNAITAYRTAAAAAVSARWLARPDSATLAVVGAGHQAAFQVRAIARVLPIRRVLAWNRTPERVESLFARLRDLDLVLERRELEAAVSEADIVVSIVSAQQALILHAWVRPGTHIAAMGTDTRGKQELEVALVASARLYTDSLEQALTIGECQHAFAAGLVHRGAITPLGAVIAGAAAGRAALGDITLYDGTGTALQDLVVARELLERHGQA